MQLTAAARLVSSAPTLTQPAFPSRGSNGCRLFRRGACPYFGLIYSLRSLDGLADGVGGAPCRLRGICSWRFPIASGIDVVAPQSSQRQRQQLDSRKMIFGRQLPGFRPVDRRVCSHEQEMLHSNKGRMRKIVLGCLVLSFLVTGFCQFAK